MSSLQQNEKRPLTVLDQKVQPREAWRILQAEYSNRPNINPDKWRLLALAFSNVPDDVLTRAVLLFISDPPHNYFPAVADLKKAVDMVAPPDALEIFLRKMTKANYRLETADPTNSTTLYFSGGPDGCGATVYR